MLREINIRGFNIIDSVNATFTPGLNIVTGETGAGKSLIVEAIQQLLGARASSGMVKSGYPKAQIIGIFDLPKREELIRLLEENGIEVADELIVLREITSTGKNSIKVNGRAIPASVMRETGRYLVNIFSQMENAEIFSPEYQLELIDSYGRLHSYRDSFNEFFSKWRDLRGKKLSIEERIKTRLQEIDFLNYQIDELRRANLVENEDEMLEEEESRLLNLERLKNDIEKSYLLLYEDDDSVISRLSRVSQILTGLGDIDPQLGDLARDLENQGILIGEVSRNIRTYMNHLNEVDSSKLEELEARIHFINELKRKYRVKSVNELLEELKKLESRRNGLEKIQEESSNLDSIIEETFNQLKSLGEELTYRRRETAEKLSTLLEEELKKLGMPDVRIRLEVEETVEPAPSGFNMVTFLIATVPDEPLKRIEDVVSGGELSRISLAIRSLLRDVESFPTFIFDEIDIGIGGKTAIAVGERIYELSRTSQVINITHLPQIAVFGDTHIYVQKETDEKGVNIKLKVLEEDERIMEISRMLTGQIMGSTIINARELINYARKIKEGMSA